MSYVNPVDTLETNSIGTLNLLESLRELDKKSTAIFITSDKCYNNKEWVWGYKEDDELGGPDPYSASKGVAELIIRSYVKSFFPQDSTKVRIASARAGNVIGGGDWSKDRLIPDAIRSLNNKKTIVIRNPNFNRPWQHVLEPLNGYLELAQRLYKDPKKYSGPWNFGTEKNTITSVEQIIKKIIKNWGNGRFKKIKNKKFYEQVNLQLNISKSKKLLNWRPKLRIDDCIKLTVDWYKKVMLKTNSVKKITENQILDYMNEPK